MCLALAVVLGTAACAGPKTVLLRIDDPTLGETLSIIKVPTEGVTSRPADYGGVVVAEAQQPNIAVFGSPTDPAPSTQMASPNSDGVPLVFLVRESQGDWLRVLLPVRPNGSTGWIKADQVSLARDMYRVVIELNNHRITVYDGSQTVDSEPVGVGRSETPTPGGEYYLAELLKPPNANGPYGPFAYGISGFSDVLHNFAGGQGVIGIHGTNDPAGLGHDVSHGCIRMSNDGITKLAGLLPLGTPVDIRA